MTHEEKVAIQNEWLANTEWNDWSKEDHILRGLNSEGREFFYTGRAGEGWVSPNQSEAFRYTQSQARMKATRFNSHMALHGLRFVAVAA